jgi:hypothetical protein
MGTTQPSAFLKRGRDGWREQDKYSASLLGYYSILLRIPKVQ